MRVLPGMTVISPSDAVETRAAVKSAIEHDGPFYIRLGREEVPVINDNDAYSFELGKGVELAEGRDVAIVATGIMVFKALEARELLKADGIDCRVVNIHTIKPIDEQMIIKTAKETGGIVTAEEHSVIGGLGSAVAEVVSRNHCAPIVSIGLADTFGISGKSAELFEHFHMTGQDIAISARKICDKT
jgi:transketolase